MRGFRAPLHSIPASARASKASKRTGGVAAEVKLAGE